MNLKALKVALKDSVRMTGWGITIFIFIGPVFQLYSLLNGYIQKLLVDAITEGVTDKIPFDVSLNKILIIGIGGFILGLILSALHSFSDYVYAYWWEKFYFKLRTGTMDVLKNVSLTYFQNQSIGKIREIVSSGVNSKITMVGILVSNFVPAIMTFAIALPILFRIDKSLSLITFLALPFFITFRVILYKKLERPLLEARNESEKFSAYENEFLNQIKVIKAYNRSQYQQNLIIRAGEKLFYMRREINKLYRVFFVPSLASIRTPLFAITTLAAIKALKGEISVGDVFLYTTYVNTMYSPLWTISQAFNKFQEHAIKAGRLDEMLKEESEFASDNEVGASRVDGDIIFKNVKFSYDDGRQVLKNINLEIKKGSVVAFVGKSGVGKSTLIKLLLRFVDPTSGEIFIGDKEITTIPKKRVREKIGIVFQDTSLFNDTVKNNILLGRTSANLSQVKEAAKRANAHAFVEKLPKGYNTVVGERGVKLSGGEQQRINLARAILKNPPILILDEATSSLDSESEQLIQESLWKFVDGRTTIIIAHRLSTVMKADQIVVVDKGTVAEVGTHEELLEQKGIYSKLFEIQSGGYLDTIEPELSKATS